MNLAFLLPAIVTVAGACAAMMLRGLVHCALALAVAFVGIATLYLSLGAEFLGLAQLLVYVGAVAVLIVFVILLTQPAKSAEKERGSPPLLGMLIAATVFAVMGWAILHSFAARAASAPAPRVTVRELGMTLMTHYVLPLEVIGLLLTAALIGAVILAMKETAMKETQSTR